MTSINKLNLKDYVQTDQTLKHENTPTYSTHQFEQKGFKNQRKSSNRESKKIKLNTLPCEQIQKDNNQMFLFRSTWQDDMQHLKPQIKDCTSPTFATEIFSNANNQSSLFPFTDQINQHQEESSKRTRVSNSRSKSKHNKSIQKFIGDSVSTHRPSSSTVEKTSVQMGHQNQPTISSNQQEMYIYQMKKLESVTHELRRQNKKLDEKCKHLKGRCEQLEELNCEKVDSGMENLMTNDVLLQKMKNESFWKFYLKADKMIKASMAENNQQSFASPINFMKQLQALREMSSQMKKENKSLRKTSQQKSEQVERMKDKLSVQEAEVQEMRLKCVAYESSMKRLRQQVSRKSRQLQKLSIFSSLELKYTEKTLEANNLSNQVSILMSQLQQQKLLNSECEKQRLSTKKKCQQLNDQVFSLNKQLSAIKTSYNLLQIQKQQLSANKKELIEKQRLKERVFHLQKEIKTLLQLKEQGFARMTSQCEARLGKQIQVKQSRVKELDSKVQQIMGNITELQTENAMYSEDNKRLNVEINRSAKDNNRLLSENKGLMKQVNELKQENTQLSQQLQSIRAQYEAKLNELSANKNNLTQKLNEQGQSLLRHEKVVEQLKRQVQAKEQLLKLKEYESEKLKASLGMIREQAQQTKLHSKLHEYQGAQINQKQGPQRNSHSRLPDKDSRLGQYQRDQRDVQSEISQIGISNDLYEQAKRLEQRLNQALEMYQQAYNQKVEMQLQLQYAQQQVQKLSIQLEQISLASAHSHPNQPTNSQLMNNATISQETLQIVENLLTIKQEIIRKILIFCPHNFKTLLVQYIYYADMIKEKYFQIINPQLQNHHHNHPHLNHQNDTSHDNSYLQPDESHYHHSQTTLNRFFTHSNSYYNQTKPYQSRKPQFDHQQSSELDSEPESLNNLNYQQHQINYLVEEFLKIGQIIDEQTRTHYQNPNSKDRKKNCSGVQLHSSKQKQQFKQQQFRRSKQKQIQHSKNLLNQLNRKIQKVKQNNINDENSFHYEPASKLNKKSISQNHNKFRQDQKYPSETFQRPKRLPLPLNEDKNQPNISRPLFTRKDIKINNPDMTRNPYQEQDRRQHNPTQRSNMISVQQTPYQKGPQGPTQSSRNNFNHGVTSKLSMLKIYDKIRQ